jgi:hypothetical protein
MMSYQVSPAVRARVAAAGRRARAQLAEHPDAASATRTIAVTAPTFDEQLDGVRPIMVFVTATREGATFAVISYTDREPTSAPAEREFSSVVADFLADGGTHVLAINAALSAAAQEEA